MPASVLKTVFLGVSLLALWPGAAFSQELQEAVIQPPAVVEETAAPPAVTEAEAAIVPPSCTETPGLIEQGALHALYMPAPVTMSESAQQVRESGLAVTGAKGTVFAGSKPYALQSISLRRDPAIPLSSVAAVAEIRMVHVSAEGDTITVLVPVTEGRENLGIGMLLSYRDGMYLDPNEFLPETRTYGIMPKTDGACNTLTDAPYFIMLHPVEMSAVQLQEFDARF